MAQEFQNRNEYFKNKPEDELSLVTMRKYLNKDCQEFLDEAIIHFELCQQYF